MIDRSLNYGRHLISKFSQKAIAPSVVVDLGAGHGSDLKIVQKNWPTADLHAVECWPPYVESLSRSGISVHPLDIERDTLPFEDGSVDIIIANQVLEHTKELFWIFHEVSRVLKPGGQFIIGVPNLASLHNRILLSLGRQPTSIKSASAHVRGFTKGDIIDFVDSCFPKGFELCDFGGSNFYPFPPVFARPLAHLFPTFAWGIFLVLQKSIKYERQFLEFPANNQLETNFFVGVD